MDDSPRRIFDKQQIYDMRCISCRDGSIGESRELDGPGVNVGHFRLSGYSST